MRYSTILNSRLNSHPKGNYHSMTFARGAENSSFPKYVETIKQFAFSKTPTALPEGRTEIVREDETPDPNDMSDPVMASLSGQSPAEEINVEEVALE
jgi:hypothetical protein